MKKTFFKTALLVALTAIFLFVTSPDSKAEYPESPVSMVVAYSPGGATDFQARIVSMMAGLDNYLGQPIVIINKPGAGGQVGWNWCVEKGTKDGYTMLAYNVPHFIAQSIVYKTKYNINTFEPVANWGADPAVLIVPKDSPFNTLQDLVDFVIGGDFTDHNGHVFVGFCCGALLPHRTAGDHFGQLPPDNAEPPEEHFGLLLRGPLCPLVSTELPQVLFCHFARPL